jgi:hypothetical protein
MDEGCHNDRLLLSVQRGEESMFLVVVCVGAESMAVPEPRLPPDNQFFIVVPVDTV